MERAEIYREAAELIHRGLQIGCCGALYDHSHERALFSNLYRQDSMNYRHDQGRYAWTGFWGCNWSDKLGERKQCRVLALLFAAAMAETGDL